MTDLETQQCCLTGDAILPADSSCELAALRISLGKQQIFRIDYSYDDKKYFNHYLLAAPPVDKNLYKKWLDLLKNIKSQYIN